MKIIIIILWKVLPFFYQMYSSTRVSLASEDYNIYCEDYHTCMDEVMTDQSDTRTRYISNYLCTDGEIYCTKLYCIHACTHMYGLNMMIGDRTSIHE